MQTSATNNKREEVRWTLTVTDRIRAVNLSSPVQKRLLYDKKKRRPVRLFSERPVSEEVIVHCIAVAASAPSGANLLALVVRGRTGPCGEKTDT